MPSELGLRQAESEVGEGAVTEQLWRPIVGMDPSSLIWRRQWHRRAAAAQARRSSLACLASTSRREATEATTKSCIVVVTVAAQAWRSMPACFTLATRGGATGATGQHHKVAARSHCRSCGGRVAAAATHARFVASLLGVEVKDKRGSWQQGATRVQNLRALREGDWCDGRVILNGESFFPVINMCECHITNQ